MGSSAQVDFGPGRLEDSFVEAPMKGIDDLEAPGSKGVDYSADVAMRQPCVRPLRCPKCLATRNTPSPLDLAAKQPYRAWSPSWVNCRWCDELEAIVNSSQKLVGVDSSRQESHEAPWQDLLQAMFSLKLEGIDVIAYSAIEKRCRMFSQLSQGQLRTTISDSDSWGTLSQPSYDSCFEEHSAQVPKLRALAAIRQDRVDKDDAAHPRRRQTARKALPRSPSKGDDDSTSQGTPSVAQTPLAGRKFSTSCCDESAIDMESSSVVSDLSIGFRYPVGQLGQSLARMRNTINFYTEKLSESSWYESFRAGTVKALERRLLNYHVSVKQSMHVDVMKGYGELQLRVSSLLALHKAIDKWLFCDCDMILVHKHFQPLLAYFRYQQLTLAPDLRIVLSMAEFRHAFSIEKTVSDACASLDFASVCQSFVEIDVLARTDKVNAESYGESQSADAPSAPEVANRFGGNTPRGRRTVNLTLPSSAADLITSLLDKVFLIKLYDWPAERPSFSAYARALLGDLERTCSFCKAWMTAGCADALRDELHDTAEALHAIATVVKTVCEDSATMPQPTKIREANKIIFTAGAAGPRCFKSCEAMSHYTVAKSAMEIASRAASSGVKDDAADAAFDLVRSSLEDMVSLACEDVESLVTRGNGGAPHDLRSFEIVLSRVQSICAELRVCLGDWSAMRLEKRKPEVDECFNYIECLMEVAPYVAVSEFVRLVPITVCLEPELDVATPTALATVDDGHVAKVHASADQEPAWIPDCAQGADGDGVAPASTPPYIRPIVRSDAKLQALAAKAVATKEPLTSFMSAVIDRLTEAQSVISEYANAFGFKLDDGGGESKLSVISFDKARQAVVRTSELLAALFDYIPNAVSLANMPALSLGGARDLSTAMEFTTTLASFCRCHRQLASASAFDLGFAQDVDELCQKLRFAAAVQAFCSGLGQRMFDKHAAPSVNSALQALESAWVVVNAVQSKIVDGCQLAEMISLLVQRPLAKQLAEPLVARLSEIGVVPAMSGLTHNTVKLELDKFIDAINCDEVYLPCLTRVSDDASVTAGNVPSPVARLYIAAQCLVTDVAHLASSIHQLLFVPVEDGRAVDLPMLFQTLPSVINAMGSALTELDELLRSPALVDMEKTGWHARVPFETLRSWQLTMAIYRKRASTCLLTEWAKHLQEASVKAKGACPSWEACFQNGELKEDLAQAITKGKRGHVITSYNSIHDTLTLMRDAATTMSVTPRLQHHPATAEAIAIALHHLEYAKKTLKVVDGIYLLRDFQDHPLGGTKAREFLSQTTPDDKREIPNGFWAKLSALAADTSDKGATRIASEVVVVDAPAAAPATGAKRPCEEAVKGAADWSEARLAHPRLRRRR